MKVTKTPLARLLLLEPVVHRDHRGFFLESYNRSRFLEAGLDFDWVQDNHSLSVAAGTLRGLHFQKPPKAQTKLVRVLRGAIYDVAVDLREGSATKGQWYGVILSSDNHRQLLIPKGFAHGFCTLVENTEVSYKVDELYSSVHDSGVIWNDPDLSIPWPVSEPLLSDKDAQHPRLVDAGEMFPQDG